MRRGSERPTPRRRESGATLIAVLLGLSFAVTFGLNLATAAQSPVSAILSAAGLLGLVCTLAWWLRGRRSS